jgi:hypothetical protein
MFFSFRSFLSASGACGSWKPRDGTYGVVIVDMGVSFVGGHWFLGFPLDWNLKSEEAGSTEG